MKIRLFFLLLLLTSLPLSADTLTELTFRMLAPEIETGTPTKLYRYQDTHLRLERGQQLSIHRGFDIWDIDLESGTAEYSTDPDGETKVWIYPPDQIPEEFHDLEFGYETKFLDKHPFVVVGEEMIEDEECRILEYKLPGGTVRFWVNSDNLPAQVEMSDSEELLFRIRYDSYRLPLWTKISFTFQPAWLLSSKTRSFPPPRPPTNPGWERLFGSTEVATSADLQPVWQKTWHRH